MRPELVALCDRLGLEFSDPSLLERATTHRSYNNERPHWEPDVGDYELLEFLGDAVIEMVVTDVLYDRYCGHASEGDLTSMRAALVNAHALAEAARRIGLGSCLRMAKGEIQCHGQDDDSILCCALEALVAAVFKDQGMGMARVLVEGLIVRQLTHMLAQNGGDLRTPKGRLQEDVQACGLLAPRYVTVHESGPDHFRFFKVNAVVGENMIGTGEGKSQKAAQVSAAQDALNHQERWRKNR
mgnify:CR=1 FL=1